MSADNCLAILGTSDGTYRVADIHMIWLDEPNILPRLMQWSENFNFSPVFHNYGAALTHAETVNDGATDLGHFIEYGVASYNVPMTWDQFYTQSRADGHWCGIKGRCETCQNQCQGSGRKFESLLICQKCFELFA